MEGNRRCMQGINQQMCNAKSLCPFPLPNPDLTFPISHFPFPVSHFPRHPECAERLHDGEDGDNNADNNNEGLCKTHNVCTENEAPGNITQSMLIAVYVPVTVFDERALGTARGASGETH